VSTESPNIRMCIAVHFVASDGGDASSIIAMTFAQWHTLLERAGIQDGNADERLVDHLRAHLPPRTYSVQFYACEKSQVMLLGLLEITLWEWHKNESPVYWLVGDPIPVDKYAGDRSWVRGTHVVRIGNIRRSCNLSDGKHVIVGASKRMAA
jgi:hypothetical protein